MIKARYQRIIFFFGRFLLSFVVWDLVLPIFGGRRWALKTRSGRLKSFAIAYRNLAVQMGGVLIKVGQFLSTRVDILPIAFTQELEGLQDEVPPVDFIEIRKVAEAEYEVPLAEKFAAFDPIPLASASFGQVHQARLHRNQLTDRPAKQSDGKEVVVKIQRPNMENIIATDLAALRTVGAWLNRYPPIQKRMNIQALLQEFSRILYEEIDYLAEGSHAETLCHNFSGYPNVRFPYVVWSHTTRRALTLENVWGIKITDYAAISQAGIDRQQVASRLLDTYLKQIFEDGFFHADPHPGNLFVNPTSRSGNEKTEWDLTFVDFGMVGQVSQKLKQALRELVVGVGTRDTTRLIRAYQMMDILLPNADLKLLQEMEEKAFEKFWGKNMSELSEISFEEMREFSKEFRELVYEMPFQVPQNIIFLARCVSILSGICTGLDPHFNLWDHLAPYAQKLITEEAGGSTQYWLGEVEKYVRTLLAIPYRIENTLTKIEKGELSVRTPEIKTQIEQLDHNLRLIPGGIIFAALFLGGIQLYLAEQYTLASALISGATLNFIWLLWYGRKRR